MARNPYRQALLAIGIFGLGIAAVVFLIVAAVPFDAIDDPFFWIRELLPRLPWALFAAFLALVGSASLLAWLYSSAKRWAPAGSDTDAA